MSHLLSSINPAISSGVMAVGTAATAMLLLAAIWLGIWTIAQRIIGR